VIMYVEISKTNLVDFVIMYVEISKSDLVDFISLMCSTSH
jgi:hypothetical protein